MGLPSAPWMPSQSPVPVGFKPAWRPNGGTKAGSTVEVSLDTVEAVAVAAGAETEEAAADVAVATGAVDEAATELKTVAAVDEPAAGADEVSVPASIALA